MTVGGTGERRRTERRQVGADVGVIVEQVSLVPRTPA
jgi:hypothetical protein